MLSSLRIRAAGLALSACTLALAGDDPPTREVDALSAAERARAEAFERSGAVEDRWAWVEALARVGWAHAEAGDHQASAERYRAAIEALPGSAADDEPEFTAILHDGLGRALQNEGEFAAAERHLREAIRLRRDDDTQRGISEGHLGLLQLVRGRYAEAEQLFRSALHHTPPDRDDLLAHRHDCLGRYHLALRAHGRARGHFEQALVHASKLVAPDAPLIVDLRSNVALCRFRQDDPRGALEEIEPLLVDPGDDPIRRLRHAGLLNLAASIHAALDQLAAAEKETEQALAILADLKGADHPSRAPVLANLGAVRHEAGDPLGALEPLEEARRILAANVSEHHQARVEVLYRIAACRLDAGQDAQRAVDEARRAAHELMGALIAGGTERELLTFRQQVDLHSIVCRLGDAGRIADSLLCGKGRIMEAVLERRTRSLDRARRLARLQSELDRLRLAGSPGDPARLAKLQAGIDALSRDVPSDRPRSPALRWQDLARSLPEKGAYVDCVRYRNAGGETRYGAVLVTRDAAPRWIPLGDEDRLGRIELLHRSLRLRAEILRRDGGEAGIPMTPLLADLHRHFWQPVAAALPEGTGEVIVCPEGRLHLLPFAVLRSPEGRFLCEELDALRLVDAGRRLLEPAATPPALDRPWVALGVADFSAYRQRLRAGSGPWSPRWIEVLEDVSDLPLVREEIDSLRRIGPPGSEVLIDDRAGESALRALSVKPAVLHLASHGFNVPLSPARDLADDPSALYEHGILLSLGGSDDGILFPEEAGALDLRDTLLVTLSTCRGALGRPVSGEGMLGLRRGFTKAGARHVLGSLWEIPDRSTADFMRKYYASLRNDPHPSRLLWRMQAERFAGLAGEDPRGDRVETAILSFGGFVMTSSR